MEEYVLWIYWTVLHYFSEGKSLEVRSSTSYTKKIKQGDTIFFNMKFRRTVKEVRTYSTLQEIMANEDPAKIAPGVPLDTIFKKLQEIYPRTKGFIVFELIKTPS